MSSRRSGFHRVVTGLAWLLAAALLLAAAAGTLAWRWLDQPLTLSAPSVELSIEPGTSPRAVASAWVEAGVQTSPEWLYQWFRWSGEARRIRAGSYAVDSGVTPRTLHQKSDLSARAMMRSSLYLLLSRRGFTPTSRMPTNSS